MLVANDIHKVFNDASRKLHVLRGIDLTVEEGAFVAIVGPSGAGKSTLLHILGGLDEPTSGQVTLDGEDVYRLNDVERARIRNRKNGFVFQFYHLLPELSALENVFWPAMVKGELKNIKDYEPIGMSLLEKVGLKERASHKPNELSGGEQQRVAIARALINSPKIIFCDEPTGNLDSESGKQVIDLLVNLNKTRKQALVIVTHDEAIARLSHKVVRIRDGVLN